MINKILIANILLFSMTANATDVVPYFVKHIKPIGAGFVELVGPGKMKIKGKTITYEGTKYISTKNIDSMTGFNDVSKGCILHYSSENYTQNISVSTQSCNAIISIISIVNK